MISVEKAKALIVKNTGVLPVSKQLVAEVQGCVLAENIKAPLHLPPFDQSAMDGYALIRSDVMNQKKIKIVGEVAAGKFFKRKIKSGEAVRIFTGAPVPAGADAVIMQEKVTFQNGYIIAGEVPLKSENIRKAGSQIKQGKVALQKGAVLTPGSIGYLTAMGIASVNIFTRPRISVIVTGSELKKPGTKLKSGQIYESNSYALAAALKSIGIPKAKIISIPDDELKTEQALQRALTHSDMILLTGGISVGDYDFVGKALQKLRVKNIFYKIKQKPGKPLFFGKYNKTLIFGLPGNPAAVLSCFYEYVYPAIRLMQGHKQPFLRSVFLPLLTSYTKKTGLSFFLKGKISEQGVTPLHGQESYIVSSFSQADSLIYLTEQTGYIKKGTTVEVHLLPGLY